jgi:hypothetical protein
MYSFSAKTIGNKARYLLDISSIVETPPFFVLTTSLLNDILHLDENSDIFDEILEIWTKKIGILQAASKIDILFKSIIIPISWQEEIYLTLKCEGISEPYAIRSSSIFEDNHLSSGAGIFETYLNVSQENIFGSIIGCLSSIFKPKAVFFTNTNGKYDIFQTMGVIIQKMVNVKTSGILFTSNPLMDKTGEYIEYTDDYSSKITDGNAEYKTITLNKNKYIDKIWLKPLLVAVNNMKKTVNYELDVEWAYDNEKLYILQMRPILQSCKKLANYQIRPINEISVFSKKQMGYLSEKYNSWKFKKSVLYGYCKKLSIRVLEWYLLFIDEMCNIRHCCDEINKLISSDYIHFMYNTNIIDTVIKKDDLYYEIFTVVNMFKNTPIILSLREMRENQYSFITKYNNINNTVFMEAVPGAMKGLKSGFCVPASFLIKQNSYSKIKVPNFPEYYKYDIERNKMITVKNGELPNINKKQFIYIYNTTKNLFDQGISGALEWWGCNEEMIVTDISNTKLNCDNSNIIKKEISPGKIYGKVIEVDEEFSNQMKDISYSNAISVSEYDESLKEYSAISKLLDKIREIKSKDTRVILKSKRPILAIVPFLNEVDGIIFEDASLLCHLSIILRESNLPAVCIGEKYINIKNGDWIDL